MKTIAIAIAVVARSLLSGAAIGAAAGLAVALLGIEVLLALGEGERVTAIATRKCLICHYCVFSHFEFKDTKIDWCRLASELFREVFARNRGEDMRITF